MNNINSLVYFMILNLFCTSCALLSSHYKTEYRVDSSRIGVDVYLQTGELLGQTPLELVRDDFADAIDGRFVTLILTKEGYYTRVVLFDITESVNIKIDLKIDRLFNKNKISLYKRLEQIFVEKETAYKDEQKILNQQLKTKNQMIISMQGRIEFLSQKEQKLENKSERLGIRNERLVEQVSKQAQIEIKNQLLSKQISSAIIPECIIKTKLIKKKVRHCPKVLSRYYLPRETNEVINQLLSIQFLILHGKFSIAKAKILKLEAKHPRVSALYTLLAYVELQSNKFGEAKKYIKRSLALNKKDQMAVRMSMILDNLAKESK